MNEEKMQEKPSSRIFKRKPKGSGIYMVDNRPEAKENNKIVSSIMHSCKRKEGESSFDNTDSPMQFMGPPLKPEKRSYEEAHSEEKGSTRIDPPIKKRRLLPAPPQSIEEKITLSPINEAKKYTIHWVKGNRTSTEGNLLKHYMVVKDGDRYEFPIKHLYHPDPTETSTLSEQEKTKKYKLGNSALVEYGGGQPQAFGGNQDWQSDWEYGHQLPLTDSRDKTLKKEYAEESLSEEPRELRIIDSQAFWAKWGIGTISIASIDQGLIPKPPFDLLKEYSERGKAEMRGTIIVDFSEAKKIENATKRREKIVEKIKEESEKFWDKAKTKVPFEEIKESDILYHLIDMINKDIIKPLPESPSSVSSSSPSSEPSSTPFSEPSSTPSSVSSSTPSSETTLLLEQK